MINHPANAQEFEALIQNDLVLVDFYTSWCGPCRMLADEIIALDEEKIDGLTIVKVDAEEIPELSMKYKIQFVPTLFLFKKGQVIKSVSSFMDVQKLKKFIYE